MAERAAKGILENIEEALFRFFLPQIFPGHPNVADPSIRVPFGCHSGSREPFFGLARPPGGDPRWPNVLRRALWKT
jgi:hypothetical protein